MDEARLFDLGLAQRFVLNRVFELGWTIGRFGWFDRNQGRFSNDGRSANKPERIGKKYQWLAWHEFLARVSDNFQYAARMDSDVRTYEGPWQDFDRDIDPSLLITETAGDRSKAVNVWWSPGEYVRWRDVSDDAEWVAIDSDLPVMEAAPSIPGPQRLHRNEGLRHGRLDAARRSGGRRSSGRGSRSSSRAGEFKGYRRSSRRGERTSGFDERFQGLDGRTSGRESRSSRLDD